MRDLVVLSNRGPVSYRRDESGALVAKKGAGGLIVVLGPGVERDAAMWVSSAMTDDDREAARLGLQEADGISVDYVVIEPDDYRAYYDVVGNQTVWFCLHGLWDLTRRPRFDRHWWTAWEAFKAVNEQFAAKAASVVAPGGTVLIQDYQLALVPAKLARLRPDVRTATFIHTPWCSPSELAVIPDAVVTELLAGLSGGGACGFHAPRWASAFEACCEQWLGQTPATFVSPAAPDVADIRSVASSDGCEADLRRLSDEVGDRKLIVRVDRIEPSKNVLRGFWAFDELLEQRPDLRGKVVFAAMVYPSRLGLAEYVAYGQEVQALVGHINSKWSTGQRSTGQGSNGGWTPILLDPEDNYPRSVAALRLADVLLVNPIRDGLNLVAKEGPIVNDRDASVVLSRNAGAWDELRDDVLSVNPFDISGTAAALSEALDMPAAERHERATRLRKAADARGPLDWWDDHRAAARVP